MTTAVSSDGEPYGSDDAPTLLPTRTIRPFHTTEYPEDKPTPEATVHSRENSTDSRVKTDHSSDKEVWSLNADRSRRLGDCSIGGNHFGNCDLHWYHCWNHHCSREENVGQAIDDWRIISFCQLFYFFKESPYFSFLHPCEKMIRGRPAPSVLDP
ncbi:podoplanin isoform X2 [Petaurus breviceps papuanus]